MRLMLDTTFVIDHLRQDPQATQLFQRLAEGGDSLYVCDIVVCETYAGTHPGGQTQVDRFFRFLEFVQPGPDAARQAGAWRAEALRGARIFSPRTKCTTPLAFTSQSTACLHLVPR